MQATLLLASSVLLQFVAAALALRLIRITGGRWTWSLIAAAVALMAVRRSITLTRILTDHGSLKPDLWAELEAPRRFRNLVGTVDVIVREADLNRRRFPCVSQRAPACLAEIRETQSPIPVVISPGNVGFELDESLADQAALIRKPFRLTEPVYETLDRAALETGGCRTW